MIAAGLVLLAILRDPAVPDRSRPLAPVPAERDGLVLAVLGTSLTARSTWPEALAEALGRCSGRQVRLVRIARPGANSSWGRQQAAALAAARPDLVLVEFTINDADIRDGVWLEQSRENHRAMVAELRQAVPEASLALVTLNPPRGWRRLTRPFLGRYLDLYAELAAQEGIGLIDLDPVWRAALDGGAAAALVPDGLHPAPAAVARITGPALLKAIGPAVSAGC